jgi:hypothetical protein
MNTLVYNRDATQVDPSWDAVALRVGMLLSEFSYSIGAVPYFILYEKFMLEKADIPFKIKIILESEIWDETDSKMQFDQMLRVYKIFKKRAKNLKKNDLIYMRKFESLVDITFKDVVAETVKKLIQQGLHQLKPISEMENGPLILWHLDKNECETGDKYGLSQLLKYELDDQSILAPDLFVLCNTPAKELGQLTELTPVLKLPNINAFQNEQLLSLRSKMKDMRNELASFIPLAEADHLGNRYLTGIWDVDGLKKAVPQMQQRLDAMEEIKWAREYTPSGLLQVSVGSIETGLLWNFLHKKEMIPPKTCTVIEKTLESGIHVPHIPIMTIWLDHDPQLAKMLSEEEVLQHRRKTINID